MENEIEELKEEVTLLEKRIKVLEGKDNRRQAYKYLKIFFKFSLIILSVFAIWRGYDYVAHEIPNIIEEKIQNINPFKRG